MIRLEFFKTSFNFFFFFFDFSHHLFILHFGDKHNPNFYITILYNACK